MLCMDIRVFFKQKTETYVLNKQFKTTSFCRLEKIIEFRRIVTFSSGLFGDRWSKRLRQALNEPIKQINLSRKCEIFPGDHLFDVLYRCGSCSPLEGDWGCWGGAGAGCGAASLPLWSLKISPAPFVYFLTTLSCGVLDG